jgi:alkyl sulfatase BDS1-like metallo-beta-lactamase superfamily hydrolase
MLSRRNFCSSAGLAAPLAAIPMIGVADRANAVEDAPPASATFGAVSADRSYQVRPEINADLKAHGAIFERKIYKIGDNVYSAVGWANGNCVMVIGDDGVIIVDTGPDLAASREVASEFRKITDKPVRAVIYTAFHVDHINGVKAFVSAEDVSAGKVVIVAHETLLANVIKSSGTIGPILGFRSAYNFGAALAGPDIQGMNLGNGPLNPAPSLPPSFIAPTKTFSTTVDITIAGVAMRLIHVPSSAADQIAVFLPQSKILLSSEVIPAQHFPTLHTLRGEAFRSPVDWYRSIDELRRFGATAMVPSHGGPVVGAAAVDEVMSNYRDVIQYVHDQTIRHMNKGLTPDELAQVVTLPPHLASYKPWTQEFFGTVRQAVRGIYQGYLGWFEGDPITLAPIPRRESAHREVALMGGRDRVLAVADKAFDDGDPQWAAELATRLIRINQDDMEARRLKAAAFRKLGYAEINATWRNWYLSGARALEIIDPEAIRSGMARLARFVVPPDLIAALPARTFVEGFSVRLKAEETEDVVMTVGFEFPDIGEAYGIVIRRGVAQFVEPSPQKADLTLRFNKAVLDRIRLGQLTMHDAVVNGSVQVSDAPSTEVERFFSYFEVPFSTPIQLVVR